MQIFLDQVWHAVFYVYDFFFATVIFRDSNFLDHFWSLSVEEQFYIVWPLLILLTPEKHLKKLFIGGIGLGPVFRTILFLLHSSGVFRILADDVALVIYPLPFSHVDAFAMGAYISRYRISNARPIFLTLAGLIPLSGFTAQYLATGSIGDLSALGFPLHLPEAYQFLWGYSLLNYFYAVLIYDVAREAWAVRLLEWKPLRYLGRISYGLYVYHLPAVWFAARLSDLGVEPPLLKPLVALIAFITTLVIASISYFLLERPLLNLKELVKILRGLFKGPIIAQANAGEPKLDGGKEVYEYSPDQYAGFAPELFSAGADAIGACCGSSREFIRKMVAKFPGK